MNIQIQAVVGCGPYRKLGEPEPYSGLSFKVLILAWDVLTEKFKRKHDSRLYIVICCLQRIFSSSL